MDMPSSRHPAFATLRRRVLLPLVALSIGGLFSACEQGDDAGPVTAMSMATSTTATLGTTSTLAVTAKDAKGDTVDSPTVAWSVADSTVATVDAKGVVTPVRAGFTTVTASSGGVSTSTTLSVRGPVAVPTRSQYVGMNLSGIAYWTTEFPFADLMKSGMGWTSREDNGTWNRPFPSTSGGYPTALAAGQHALTAVAWSSVHYLPGQYTVLWDGDGDISFPLSNVTIVSTAAHRIVVSPNDTTSPMWVGIDRTSAPPTRSATSASSGPARRPPTRASRSTSNS